MLMIIGFGTGRCGTTSLADYFNTWHEFKPMPRAANRSRRAWIKQNEKQSKQYNKTPGDVNFGHINWIDFWLDQDVTRICLIRDREATVDSMWNWPNHLKAWKELLPERSWETRDDLYRYYDWYYETIFKHEDKFVIIQPEQLNIQSNVMRDRIGR